MEQSIVIVIKFIIVEEVVIKLIETFDCILISLQALQSKSKRIHQEVARITFCSQ